MDNALENRPFDDEELKFLIRIPVKVEDLLKNMWISVSFIVSLRQGILSQLNKRTYTPRNNDKRITYYSKEIFNVEEGFKTFVSFIVNLRQELHSQLFENTHTTRKIPHISLQVII